MAEADGGRLFPTQFEGQTSGRPLPEPASLVEYGGGMPQGMGSSSNSGMNPLGSEGYFNSSQVHRSPPGYMTSTPPLSNANVLGGYPNSGYGYGSPPSDDVRLPMNIGGTPTGVDAGYMPRYTFRTSGGMDPGVEMGLSSESGMDTGWLEFMRDCGIMDITEDR